MIARQMVVRCDKCGRTFIRSMGGTQYASRLFERHAPPVCWRCQLNTPNASNTLTLEDVFKRIMDKDRKK